MRGAYYYYNESVRGKTNSVFIGKTERGRRPEIRLRVDWSGGGKAEGRARAVSTRLFIGCTVITKLTISRALLWGYEPLNASSLLSLDEK